MTHKPTKAGAKAAGKALKGETGILRHLAEEHGEVSGLMSRVSASKDPDVREDRFPEIRANILAHAEGEEAEFYPVLRSAGLDDMAERSIAEHREIEQLIEELHSGDKTDDAWHAKFERLKEAVEKHVHYEEQEVFPRVRDEFDGSELGTMLEQYERVEQSAKQRLS